jgi:tetratricopeptide (TPR) repeat protein
MIAAFSLVSASSLTVRIAIHFATLQSILKFVICLIHTDVSTQKLIYLLVGVVIGFVVGFLFTNNVNRDEQEKLRVELARLRANNSTSKDRDANSQASAVSSERLNLTDEELRRAIAKGDANSQDITLQRNLGHGLYLYAMKLDKPNLLPDAVRMLKRVHEADPKDYETTVALGNALFDTGQNGDTKSFSAARVYYLKALVVKPDDVNVRTDLGLTYYFDKPSDPKRAIKEYRQSFTIDPRHEMTLQNLAAALVATGEIAEAQKRIGELESVNSSNPALPNLRAQLTQKKNAASTSNGGSATKESN